MKIKLNAEQRKRLAEATHVEMDAKLKGVVELKISRAVGSRPGKFRTWIELVALK